MRTCVYCVTPEDCKFKNACEIDEADKFDNLQQTKELDFESEENDLDDDFDNFNDDVDISDYLDFDDIEDDILEDEE